MKKINSSISLTLSIGSIVNFYLSDSAGYYEALGKNISSFWISAILSVFALLFAYRGKKIKEAKELNYIALGLSIALAIIALLYFILFSGL